MGFFSMQKTEPSSELSVLPKEEEPAPVSSASRTGSTVIAQGVTVTGALRGEGVVQVEGMVEGEFELTGAVIVAETGLVRGPIKADVVRVAGRVEGGVYAREHIRLEPTGSLEGDVTTASLVVEDGGRLNGRCTMLKPSVSEAELQTVQSTGDLRFGPDFDLDEEA